MNVAKLLQKYAKRGDRFYSPVFGRLELIREALRKTM